MNGDLPAELIASFLAEAQDAALRREWDLVLDRTGDVLVLDRLNRDAQLLQTLAERHVGGGHPNWGRRQETVLFADLVASTALANRFDPEILRQLIRRYELACTPVITALGGHVHRFVGDGILASFGYPTAHEDDARRAVQAGLDLAAAVASTSMEEAEVGAELAVRVGIASGVLVHADRGAGSWAQAGDLFGPAVNLAARIHEVAEPGHVCISDDTAALVSEFFDLEPPGDHHLKGFEHPVSVHAVVRRADAAGWVDRRRGGLTPFVGRRDELARLEVAWRRVSGGDETATSAARSVSLVVSGDAGVGKSRLVWEFASSTVGRSTIELQCSAYRAESPLFPVRAAIERRCAFEEGDDSAARLDKLEAVLRGAGIDVEAALPYLVLLLDLDGRGRVARPEVSPTQLRETTLGHLVQWVVAIAAQGPALLVVEDLHWADPSTRELLRRITTTRPAGLLTVVTSRSPPSWVQDVGFEQLGLAPLSNGDARSLAAAASGGELSQRLVDEIARRSDGIPLFVEQLALAMTRAEPPASSIPMKLTELLQARLDSTGSSKRIAQLAATVGRDFEPELVEQVASRLQRDGKLEPFDRTLGEHFRRLVESELVEHVPDDERRMRFRHALVGEAAYESQLLAERPDRHSVLADVLLERGAAGATVDPSVVARHFTLAGRPVDAIGQHLAAATRGQAVGAFAEASADLGRAELVLASTPDDLRPFLELAIRLNRGLVTSSMGGYAAPGVIEDYVRAVELCAALGETVFASPPLVRAQLGLWAYYFVTADLDTAAAVSTAMGRQLERVSMAGGWPSFHACRGVEQFHAGDLGEARRHLETAVELFAHDDIDPADWPLPNDPLAAAMAFLGLVKYLQGDELGALATLAAGLDRSAMLPFPLGPFSMAFVRNYESWMHRMRGDLDAAEATANHVVRLGDQHGFFDWQTVGRINVAAARLAREPSAAVLGDLGEAISVYRASGGRLVAMLLVEAAWGSLALGDLDRAAICLADADELVASGQVLCRPELHRCRAALATAQGEVDDHVVEAELTAGLRCAVDQGASLFVAWCGLAVERHRLDTGGPGLEGDLREAVGLACELFAPSAWMAIRAPTV